MSAAVRYESSTTYVLRYLRVSSDEQADKGLSIPFQDDETTRYVLARAADGWVEDGRYVDVLSGKRDERVDYQRLLARCARATKAAPARRGGCVPLRSVRAAALRAEHAMGGARRARHRAALRLRGRQAGTDRPQHPCIPGGGGGRGARRARDGGAALRRAARLATGRAVSVGLPLATGRPTTNGDVGRRQKCSTSTMRRRCTCGWPGGCARTASR